MILDFTKNSLVLMLGGSKVNNNKENYPTYFMIGTGSTPVTPSQTELAEPSDRQAFTTMSYPNSQKIKWQGDWNSSEVSGLAIKEFGMTGSASTTTGSMWSRIVIPTINFDGTSELRVTETWEVF